MTIVPSGEMDEDALFDVTIGGNTHEAVKGQDAVKELLTAAVVAGGGEIRVLERCEIIVRPANEELAALGKPVAWREFFDPADDK